MKETKTGVILGVTIGVMVLCLLLLCCLVIGSLALYGFRQAENLTGSTNVPWITEPTPVVTMDPNNTGLGSEELDLAQETLDHLNQAIVPINDPLDLVGRLGGKPNVPTELIDENAPYDVGAQKEFWVTNTDTDENFKITATLQFVGENLYFWIENDVNFKQSDLKKLATTFDEEIIPTNREFFGMEWNPGVDGDPRFYVLYASGLGRSLAGYYSSADQLHPDAHPYSNAHEMFLLNSDNVKLNENYIYGTLAHEFQHMIHWYQDKNEETWVNEGFSMLAEHVNEYDAGGFDWDYMANPDMQLNDWSGDVGSNSANYGASYLFMVYFLDRFGEEATKALVSHAENGFASIDAVMRELNIINPSTGKPYTGIEVFGDWTVANWLQDSGIDNKRYDYKSYSPYSIRATESHSTCPVTITNNVHQFGVDYVELECVGTFDIQFQGSQAVQLLPFPQASSGDFFFWSNEGDESDMRLSRQFDLTEVTGPVEMTFRTWYDLEEDYDYAYLSASTDGVNWEKLQTQTCTNENPSGNSYGCGWNGSTRQWIDEKVDLSKYRGQVVTLQFDYVTDAAVNGRGIALDDFAIDAIGYQSDLEQDAGGWVEDGFVRVQNRLPQTFFLSVIHEGSSSTVEHYEIQPGQLVNVQTEIKNGEKVVLVISGTTPFTKEKATYQIEIR